jgi:ABC-type nitrate/sulfonate/bicarbonate transport system substrate-binding protein
MERNRDSPHRRGRDARSITRVVRFVGLRASRPVRRAAGAVLLLALSTAGCGGTPSATGSATVSHPPSVAANAPAASAPAASAAPAGSAAKPAVSAKPAASASAATSAAPGTVKVSWGQPAAGFGPVWLAQDQGIFKKYGLTTDVVHLAPPADTQAVISGDVQFVIGGSAAIGAMANGADIPFIAVTVPYFVQSLFSQPSIAKITDLTGKKVGVTTKGGPADLALQTLLKRDGVDPPPSTPPTSGMMQPSSPP